MLRPLDLALAYAPCPACSYKERAPMAQRHVQAFTGGAPVPEVAEGRHAELLADVQQFLLRGEQVGMQCWC